MYVLIYIYIFTFGKVRKTAFPALTLIHQEKESTAADKGLIRNRHGCYSNVRHPMATRDLQGMQMTCETTNITVLSLPV